MGTGEPDSQKEGEKVGSAGLSQAEAVSKVKGPQDPTPKSGKRESDGS